MLVRYVLCLSLCVYKVTKHVYSLSVCYKYFIAYYPSVFAKGMFYVAIINLLTVFYKVLKVVCFWGVFEPFFELFFGPLFCLLFCSLFCPLFGTTLRVWFHLLSLTTKKKYKPYDSFKESAHKYGYKKTLPVYDSMGIFFGRKRVAKKFFKIW